MIAWPWFYRSRAMNALSHRSCSLSSVTHRAVRDTKANRQKQTRRAYAKCVPIWSV